MSIHAPAEDWFQAPHGNEKVWIGLALVWCLIMSLMMPYWHFRGQQNSAGEAYSVTPEDFSERVDRFVEANTVEEGGVPVVEPPPGGHAYLMARQYMWYPVLKLRAGETYTLHLSSADVQHGFSLQPMNMNFQVMPGYDHVLTLKPRTKGTFPIVCNEFCGVGHHMMVGKVIVE